MINSPSLLLADEPTGNLDTENSNMVFDVLVKMAKEKEIAVILVTHNRELANRCDRVIEMKDGLISN
jgi:ABC-type lipoprotein export system ATPase subunit